MIEPINITEHDSPYLAAGQKKNEKKTLSFI